MRKKQMKILSVILCCAVCLAIWVIGVSANTDLSVVSYGLGVISARTDMAISAPIGNDVVFSADAFARALNLSKVHSVTVVSLPDATRGQLLLGSTRVAAGQTISGENLGYLTFEPADEDVVHANFTFTANGGATAMLCNVYLLLEPNDTPTVSVASGLSLNISTYRNMEAHGKLSAHDPDGDELRFEVVSYPQNGALRLIDASTGSYVYIPQKDFVGKDSFSYVARDQYGNYSASATVDLRVEVPGAAVQYVDMKEEPSYVAALKLTEEGVMSGTQMGNSYYFYPDRTVSRVEFLVMAMNAVGISEVPDCETTFFADDAEISPSMRGYVTAAYEMKYISGTLENGNLCFLPNEEITRAEAAVMLSNIVGLCDVAVTPTFADASEIPVWASEAIFSLNAAGIMQENDGYISPASSITRAETAEMLAAAMQYVK